MNKHKKIIARTITLVSLIIISLVIITLGLLFNHSQTKYDPSNQNSSNEDITQTGTVTCLPHKKSTGPQTLECAIGLQSTNSNYYGLKNIPTDEQIKVSSSTGQTITVTGELQPAIDGKYDIVGNINVTSISFN